jgi:hypothetical protein
MKFTKKFFKKSKKFFSFLFVNKTFFTKFPKVTQVRYKKSVLSANKKKFFIYLSRKTRTLDLRLIKSKFIQNSFNSKRYPRSVFIFYKSGSIGSFFKSFKKNRNIFAMSSKVVRQRQSFFIKKIFVKNLRQSALSKKELLRVSPRKLKKFVRTRSKKRVKIT